MGMDDFDGMESPIDSLLEQIKRGTRAMEDRQQSQSTIVPKVRRSRSGASVLSTDTDNLISEAKASEANISAEYVLRREKTKEILLISASMEQVDAAEKEASEVLHSLLSVERIEKQSLVTDPNNQQVVVVTTSDANPSLNNIQGDNVTSENQDQNAIQWHTPVTVHHALFTNMQKQQQPQQQQQQQPQQQQQQQQHQQGYLQENTTDMSVEIVSAQSSKLQENVMPNHSEDHHHETPAATIISTTGDVQQVTAIPIVLSQHNTQNDSVVSTTMTQSQQQQPTTYIVTPVSQLLQPSIGTGSGINSNNGNTFASYQLTPTSEYTSQQHINQSQVGTITVTSVQSNPYAFTTL
ncbi:Protein of unknown function, partial [Gryllus bimaculatus]